MTKAFFTVSTVSFLLASSTGAFRPLGVTKKSPSLFVQLPNKADEGLDVERVSGRRNFLAEMTYFCFMAVSCMSVGAPPPAEAATTDASSVEGSFTLLAEEIKTLDLSLPSYDSINTLKSSSEKEKALGLENPPDVPSKDPAVRQKKKNSTGGVSGGGGNPLNNILPSMNKSVDKKPRSSTTTARERPATAKRVQEEKAEVEVKTMDLSLPSYSEGIQSKERSLFAL